MKGFVPVNKSALLEMVDNCRKVVANDMAANTAKLIDKFVSEEKERMTTRRWYRLFILPAARFNFDEASIRAYAAAIDYPIYDWDPFTSMEKDAANSYAWLDRVERLAECEYAGEPIQLDMKTFLRLSEPDRYFWAEYISLYYSVR